MLMNLGLTFLQVKIYLSIAQLGKADVKIISKASKVARSDIYRIMPTLERLGLAEKIIAKTTLYKATPIKEGLSILLQNKKREYDELEQKSSSLLNNFHINNLDFLEENPEFKVISEITLFLKTHQKLMRSAQTSIDIYLGRLLPSVPSDSSYFRRAKSNVKIRLIIQREKTSPRNPRVLTKNPFFEIRYLNEPDPVRMHIFDKKMVSICVSDAEASGVPSLLSNNHSIVKLSETYFEKVWNSAEINKTFSNA